MLDTKTKLVINKLTQAQYDLLLAENSIFDDQLYFIIDDNDKFYFKSEVYNKSEVEDLVDVKIAAIIDAAPEAYNTLKEIADYIESDLSETAAMLDTINNKADKSSVYTIAEANNKFATKNDIPVVPDLSKYYTKSETEEIIEDKVGAITGLDNYYKKDEVDGFVETLNANKQDQLISGINIKTINGESILGEGNFELSTDSGGSNVIANPELDGGEDILESIQIEDTKYSLQGQDMTFSESISTNPDAKVLKTLIIGEDEWKVDKGSVVTPNVELSGDEPVLESVQIDESVFTLKGEEMIFSDQDVEGAKPVRSIILGDDIWSVTGDYATQQFVKDYVAQELGAIDSLLDEIIGGY